jgi:DNA-binding XRE family transcriptional regulator
MSGRRIVAVHGIRNKGRAIPSRDLEEGARKRTNFDRYLKEQLADPAFARRFEQAGQAWDVAFQLAALRRLAGLSQKQLAQRVKTSQQQICRLESPGYEGHSLSMLRRVAQELHARVRVVLEPEHAADRVAETAAGYLATPNRAARARRTKRLRT